MARKIQKIRCDNGPGYISNTLMKWAKKKGISIRYIQPGRPTQNTHIEHFNHTARYGWLDLCLFHILEQAQETATK